jgi:hypothetical protein
MCCYLFPPREVWKLENLTDDSYNLTLSLKYSFKETDFKTKNNYDSVLTPALYISVQLLFNSTCQ